MYSLSLDCSNRLASRTHASLSYLTDLFRVLRAPNKRLNGPPLHHGPPTHCISLLPIRSLPPGPDTLTPYPHYFLTVSYLIWLHPYSPIQSRTSTVLLFLQRILATFCAVLTLASARARIQ